MLMGICSKYVHSESITRFSYLFRIALVWLVPPVGNEMKLFFTSLIEFI